MLRSFSHLQTTSPFRECQINRDNDTGLLMQLTDEMKQQGSTFLAHGGGRILIFQPIDKI